MIIVINPRHISDLTIEGEQVFAGVGNAAFSGPAGELRSKGGLIQGDGDGVVGLQVDVLGIDSLRAEDFNALGTASESTPDPVSVVSSGLPCFSNVLCVT